MQNQLAIITSEFLEGFVKKILRDFFPEDEFIVYSYRSFLDLRPIYHSIPSHIGGIVVSGSYPAQVLRLCFPESQRIIREFNNDDLGLYKLFFGLLHSHRDLQLGRVYADVLDVGGIGPEQYLIGPFDQAISEVHMEAAAQVSLQDLTKIEQLMTRRHIDKWRNGEIDVSITRFSSIMDRLKQAGLPVYFAYPDPHYVKNVIISTRQELMISNLRDNMPGSMFLTFKRGSPGAWEPKAGQKESGRRLKQALKDFCSLHSMDYLIQERMDGFEIVTLRKFVALATANFRSCSLQGYLGRFLDEPMCIGYGLGNSFYQARINAFDANAAAAKYPDGASCLIDEKDQLIAPLGRRGAPGEEDGPMILNGVSDAVRRLAKTTGLSTFNIQKLSSVIQAIPDRRITSEELSYKLRITRRSANRMLVALKKADLARVADQKQGISLGRPEYVYEIDPF